MRANVGQEVRKNTLGLIRRWIAVARQKSPDAKIDRSALIRKIQLDIGATRSKAEEYCDLLEVY